MIHNKLRDIYFTQITNLILLKASTEQNEFREIKENKLLNVIIEK